MVRVGSCERQSNTKRACIYKHGTIIHPGFKEEKTVRLCMLPNRTEKGEAQELAGSIGEKLAAKKDRRGKKKHKKQKSIDIPGHRGEIGLLRPLVEPGSHGLTIQKDGTRVRAPISRCSLWWPLKMWNPCPSKPKHLLDTTQGPTP